jgi:hypothetical protein
LDSFDRTRRAASCSIHRTTTYDSDRNTKPPA